MGAPKELILKLLERLPADCFVETGTFMGGTTEWAASHFQKVITIEVNPEISRTTSRRLAHLINIEFVIGNSAEVLPTIAKRLAGATVFWLDGHYCGPGTGADIDECPIVAEVEALKSCVNPIILIDDARCFLGPPPPPHKSEHWIGIDDLFNLLWKNFPNHVTTILDDVVVCVPKMLKPVLDEDWHSNFAERYPFSSTQSGVFPRLTNFARRVLARLGN